MEVKVYETSGAKLLDFLLGFFILGGLFNSALILCAKSGSSGLVTVMLPAVCAAAMALAVYLYKKRKFMGIGLGLVAIGPLIVFLTYMLAAMSMGGH